MSWKSLTLVLGLIALLVIACGTQGPAPSTVEESTAPESTAPTATVAPEPETPSQPTSEPESSPVPTEETSSETRQGGTLVVALGSDPEHLNTSISSSVIV